MPKINQRQRAPQSKMRVTFNGESFCYRHPLQTILRVLREIGSDKLSLITLESNGRRVITQDVHPDDEKSKKLICDNWYYIANLVSIGDTRWRMEKIRQCLSLKPDDMKIETGPDLEVTNKVEAKGTQKPKKTIRVTFLDSETVIEDESYKDVYMECVYALDINKLAKCNNILWSGEDLITPTNTTGKRVLIDQNTPRWIIMPDSTADATKLLNLMATYLRIKLKIETINLKIETI